MSDFSVTAKCPACKRRYAPDDGECDCLGNQLRLDAMADPDHKRMAEEKQAEDALIRRVLKRRTRAEMCEQFFDEV